MGKHLPTFGFLDDLKWSVFAQRSLHSNIKLQVQVASDRLHMLDQLSKWEYRSIMQRPSHWYWMLKLKFNY